MLIYLATNNINKKKYIGQTVHSLKFRIRKHLNRLNKDSIYFHNALLKYGKEAFSWSVLYECPTKEESDHIEEFFINNFKSKAPNGYNLTDGGDGSIGFKHKESSLEKMRGKVFTEEHKRHIGETSKGRVHSIATRAKISASLIGNQYRKGIPHTEETKAKWKGRIPWNKGLKSEPKK